MIKKDLKEKTDRLKNLEPVFEQKMIELERKSLENERLISQIESLRSELLNQKSVILNRTEFDMDEKPKPGTSRNPDSSTLFADQQESFAIYPRGTQSREPSTTHRAINHSMLQEAYDAPMLPLSRHKLVNKHRPFAYPPTFNNCNYYLFFQNIIFFPIEL